VNHFNEDVLPHLAATWGTTEAAKKLSLVTFYYHNFPFNLLNFGLYKDS